MGSMTQLCTMPSGWKQGWRTIVQTHVPALADTHIGFSRGPGRFYTEGQGHWRNEWQKDLGPHTIRADCWFLWPTFTVQNISVLLETYCCEWQADTLCCLLLFLCPAVSPQLQHFLCVWHMRRWKRKSWEPKLAKQSRIIRKWGNLRVTFLQAKTVLNSLQRCDKALKSTNGDAGDDKAASLALALPSASGGLKLSPVTMSHK